MSTASNKLPRRKLMADLLARRGNSLIVTGLGSPTWDCFAAGDSPEYLYSWGGMGLAVPTALGVATAALAGVVRTTTQPAHPHGCLGVQSALVTGDSGREVRDLLVAWRNNGCGLLRERFQRAIDDGDLPEGADPGLLARYVTTLAFGIAVQAASGVGRDELQAMADAALSNWPLP